MDEIRQPATIANGGIVFLSASDKDEKEHENNPGYIYYYYTNNNTLTGNLDSAVTLEHRDSSRTIVSQTYRDDGGDAYVSAGKYYDEAHDVNVLNGGYLQINQQTVSNVDIKAGGNLTNSRGSLSNVTVRSGGYLIGTAQGVYVEKGAVLDGNIYVNGKYNQATLAPGANVGSFVNLSEKEQLFSVISRDRDAEANVSAYLYDQTLTDLKCAGVLNINGGGVVSGGEVASGGRWNINGGSAESILIDSDGGVTMYSGAVATEMEILSGGNLTNSRGSLSNVTVRSGGYLIGTAQGVYVEKGAVLDGNIYVNGKYNQATLAPGANVGSFVNLSEKEQLFSVISRDRDAEANVSAYLYDQTLTDLKCAGVLNINGGGVVSGGEVSSGGRWNINGGSAESILIDSDGGVTMYSGAVATEMEILSGGNLTNSRGSLSNVTVRSGGYLIGTAQGVYVEKGAVLDGNIYVNGKYNQATLAPGANVGSFVNLSEKEQLFSVISRDRDAEANVSAYLYDQTLTDLKCAGVLYVNGGGVISGGVAAEGARWTINSGGMAESIRIDSDGGITLANGASATGMEVLSGGNLTNSRGSLSNVTVRSGGYLIGAVQGVYVEKGAVLNGTYDINGQYNQATLAPSANVGSFVNLSEKEQTFSVISRDRDAEANVSVYLYDQTLTDLKCAGVLNINGGGVVSGGEAMDGARWTINGGELESIIIHSDVTISLNNGASATNMEVLNGGNLVGSPDCCVSGVTVRNGGYIRGTVHDIYVEEGATVDGNYWDNIGQYYQITLSPNACVESFTNLSEKDQTFSYVYRDRGSVSATLSDVTLTDLKCNGSLNISSGGIISGGEVVSGGRWNISSNGIVSSLIIDDGCFAAVNGGGRLEQSFDVAGNLTIKGGGVARIWSASTVAGESATLENGGMIEFLVASAAVGGEALLNDYTKVEGWGGYAITVNGDQSSGQYRLIGNAAAFNRNVTITVENTEFSGTFQWNGSGYNYVQLGDVFYTLHIDAESEDLILTKQKPLSITITPENFGQLYFAEKDGKTCFVLNYTFSADVTYFGGLPDGTYTYKARLNGSDGEVDFNFLITDGTISYNSGEMCYMGNVTNNNDGSRTWHLSQAVETFYINSFESDSIDLEYLPDGNDSSEALSHTETIKAVPCEGGYTDINKHYGIIAFEAISFNYNGNDYLLEIYSTPVLDLKASNYPYIYGAKLTQKTNFGQSQSSLTPALEYLNVQMTNVSEIKSAAIRIDGSSIGNFLLNCDNGTCELFLESNSASEKLSSGKDWLHWMYAVPEINACWIATGINMLCRAGVFPEDKAQTIYEVLVEKYFEKYHRLHYLVRDILPIGGKVTSILQTFVKEQVRTSSDTNINANETNRWLTFSFGTGNSIINSVEFGLWRAFLKMNNKWIVSSLSYSGHVITIYDIREIGENTYKVICADSDNNVDSPKTEERIIRLSNDGVHYEIQSKKGYGIVTEAVILTNDIDDGSKIHQDYSNLDIDSLKYKEYSPEFISAYEQDKRELLAWIGIADGLDYVEGLGFVLTSGGHVSEVLVKTEGSFLVESGATIDEIYVQPGAFATLNEGANIDILLEVTGRINVNGPVNVREVQFTLFETDPNGEAMISDLANCGSAALTISVYDEQERGVYLLADGASDFDGDVSLWNLGVELGTLTVGETFVTDDMRYTLNLNGSILSLTVGMNPHCRVGDFNGDGRAMLVTESDNTFTVYSDGAAWGGLTLDDGWFVAGVGDFDGDGADDFLRVNEEGYAVGEMSNGDGTFAPQVLNFLNEGWDILGTGDFNGNGTDDVLIANPTAAAETVGLLGYWESGVTWTLINGYSAEWECVATGDFNGDGKCDMLWRNYFEGEDGLTYNAYCTWIVDDPVDWRMVSVANPQEWNFLCSGDFDGDKMNDIAMINDVGVVGIWGVSDGWLSSWSILSAVSPEWQLAGVGDFNADGTDDIAWCSSETGQVGCWQIENRELASWQTLTTLA